MNFTISWLQAVDVKCFENFAVIIVLLLFKGMKYLQTTIQLTCTRTLTCKLE